MITYLITEPDQAGQCRIVARHHGPHFKPDLKNYHEAPTAWLDAGIMDSRGKLVCLSNSEHFKDMQADEPLAAGLTYTCED
jgi:hypothetical protein